jgi:hypothetical protein
MSNSTPIRLIRSASHRDLPGRGRSWFVQHQEARVVDQRLGASRVVSCRWSSRRWLVALLEQADVAQDLGSTLALRREECR